MAGAGGRRPGGEAELLRLAWPLVVSSSFWTLQVTVDRVLLSRLSAEAVGAAMSGVLLFWAPLQLFQHTAGYATTFVAQYIGAGRPERVGPAVWQGLYVSLAGGVLFLGLVPLAGWLVALGEPPAGVGPLEERYFVCLCYSALPTAVTAAVSGFFAGRGDSYTVLLINGVGLVVNGVLGYLWIFGEWGFPAAGIEGAGWATVAGTAASAAVGLAQLWRRPYRKQYATLAGWHFEPGLCWRLLRFGLPSGLLYALDCAAFAAFTHLVGRLGAVPLAASSVAFTINMVAVLPMLGVSQGVAILVGQRLGEDRPDLAERSTWAGFRLTWLYMTAAAALFVLVPGLLAWPFRNDADPAGWAAVAAEVPVLLRFVAVYSLFDSMNLVFSSALKGAGDTRFVTLVSVALAWPLMVLPTREALRRGWGLYACWGFASAYIIALALVFLLRFRSGKWQSMRVIETAPAAEPTAAPGANGF
jgi:MATE family multidrug resistance protein